MKFLIFLIIFTSLKISAQEGVSTEIDPKRLNEVMDWVNNAKFELDLGAKNIAKSPHHEQERDYSNLIDTVLKASGSRTNEFLMRNLLYRTQVVYKSFQNTPRSPKRDALARRVLEDGVLWAIKLYEIDKSLLDQMKSKEIPNYIRGVSFVNLGLEWTQYMFGLYYSAPDNKSKVRLMRDLMGLLYNDINNDDAVKRILAPVSGKLVAKDAELKNLLQSNPPKTPLEELALARDLRRFIDQHIQATKDLLSPYTKELDVAKSKTYVTVEQDLTGQYLKLIDSGLYVECNGSDSVLYRGAVIKILSKIQNGTQLSFVKGHDHPYQEKINIQVVENFGEDYGFQRQDAPLNCEAKVPFTRIIHFETGKIHGQTFEIMTPVEVKLFSEPVRNGKIEIVNDNVTYLLDQNTHKITAEISEKAEVVILGRDQILAHKYIYQYKEPLLLKGERAIYQLVKIVDVGSTNHDKVGYIRVNHIRVK